MRFPKVFLALLALAGCPEPEPGPDGGVSPCPALCQEGYACDPAVGICQQTVANRASNKLAEVRRSNGANLPLELEGVVVTAVVPRSDDYGPSGFFVQAEQAGPGIFVNVNPEALSPNPTPGDRVKFSVTAAHAGGDVVEIQGVSNYTVLESGVDLGPLTQDISTRPDLIELRWLYDGELVRIDATLQQDWFPWAPNEFVSSLESTGGFRNSKFVLRVPLAVTTEVGRAGFCDVAAERVGFRAFTASSELWSYTREALAFDCPENQLQKALALSNIEVKVRFDRPLDASTVPSDGSAFEIPGLAITGCLVDGAEVTLLTSVQTPRAGYEVKVKPGVKDVLGGAVISTSPKGQFLGHFPRAVLRIDEVQCSGPGGRDLVELRVMMAGSTADLELTYDGEPVSTTLMTFPDVAVASEDLIVVHLNADPLAGDAIFNELSSKTEQPTAANFANAWDFVTEDTTCRSNAAVVRIRSLSGETRDGVAYAHSAQTNPSLLGSSWLRGLQKEEQWMPRSCGGFPCSTTTSPTVQDVVVDSKGMGFAGGVRTSISRKGDADTNAKADWALANPASFGALNP